MEEKVLPILARLKEVESKLAQLDIVKDQENYLKFAREHAFLSDVRDKWEKYLLCQKVLQENSELMEKESDPELLAFFEEEIRKEEEKLLVLERELTLLLIPPDPLDNRNTILELRAGTGGEEAALFVADCARMYKHFADRKGWKYEELSSTPSDMGGFREYILVFIGEGVYRSLRHEGGTHRVQRVPETEAQGRVHTSAITVAVLLEPEKAEEVHVEEKELRIETFRSSGAGGQHVNVTDSAVRITHRPSGIVVACQEERSQFQNKEKALRLLRAKLADLERQKREKERAQARLLQVGTGDRSERVRTYNFSQNRITDHRIQFTRYNLDRVMEGELDELTSELINRFYMKYEKA